MSGNRTLLKLPREQLTTDVWILITEGEVKRKQGKGRGPNFSPRKLWNFIKLPVK